jgi:hypothetical protein
MPPQVGDEQVGEIVRDAVADDDAEHRRFSEVETQPLSRPNRLTGETGWARRDSNRRHLPCKNPASPATW